MLLHSMGFVQGLVLVLQSVRLREVEMIVSHSLERTQLRRKYHTNRHRGGVLMTKNMPYLEAVFTPPYKRALKMRRAAEGANGKTKQ